MDTVPFLMHQMPQGHLDRKEGTFRKFSVLCQFLFYEHIKKSSKKFRIKFQHITRLLTLNGDFFVQFSIFLRRLKWSRDFISTLYIPSIINTKVFIVKYVILFHQSLLCTRNRLHPALPVDTKTRTDAPFFYQKKAPTINEWFFV